MSERNPDLRCVVKVAGRGRRGKKAGGPSTDAIATLDYINCEGEHEKDKAKLLWKFGPSNDEVRALLRPKPSNHPKGKKWAEGFHLVVAPSADNAIAKDGPRYAALGNSMSVNVMKWIGMRIDAVDKLLKKMHR